MGGISCVFGIASVAYNAGAADAIQNHSGHADIISAWLAMSVTVFGMAGGGLVKWLGED